MRRAAGIPQFLANPAGYYVSGKSFAVWVHSPTLAGSVYFGRPDPDDFADLLALQPLYQRLEVPFDGIIDCGRLLSIETAAFQLMLTHIVAEIPAMARRVRAAAVVRPAGMPGATVAGMFHDLVAPVIRATLFTDRVEAFGWLGRPDGAQALAELDEVLEGLFDLPLIVRQLRDWIRLHLDNPTVESAARALGSSTRSLQRVLTESGTSFRAEIDRARVRAAEAALLHEDVKLEAIARQVGCASLSGFSKLFRRVTGETPTEFRERRVSTAWISPPSR
jgi:AraC-like DNA-binding protein